MLSNTEIGNQINKYRGSQLRKVEIFILLFSFLLLSLIPFFIGFYRSIYGYAQYGPTAAKSWGVFWFFLSIFFLIPIISYGLYRINRSQLLISLYTSGIKIRRLFRNELIILWDQVTDLYVTQERAIANIRPSRTYCIIKTTDSKQVTLRSSEIDNLLELITQIKSFVYIHLYPGTLEAYRVGRALTFGPIEIHRKYIKIKRFDIMPSSKQVCWKDVDYITIKSGYLILRLHNQKTYQIKVSKIPNIEILFRLIEDYARIN
jgi:hypothetical protein